MTKESSVVGKLGVILANLGRRMTSDAACFLFPPFLRMSYAFVFLDVSIIIFIVSFGLK